jgi:hypothetical protein
MTQVSRTVNQLINNSLYLLGELGVNETPDSFMLSTGLDLINELLDKLSADSIYIPYLTTLAFTMVPGQADYEISNIVTADVPADRIVDLSFANYTVPGASSGIIYPLRIIAKSQFYNVTRVTPFDTRPSTIFLDKQAFESIVTIYPAPDQPYPCELRAKIMIDQLDEHEDLGSLPPFYYGFMKRALARTWKQYYPSGNWTEKMEEEYWDYYNILKSTNETDVTIRPSMTLTRSDPFWWQNILAY